MLSFLFFLFQTPLPHFLLFFLSRTNENDVFLLFFPIISSSPKDPIDYMITWLSAQGGAAGTLVPAAAEKETPKTPPPVEAEEAAAPVEAPVDAPAPAPAAEEEFVVVEKPATEEKPEEAAPAEAPEEAPATEEGKTKASLLSLSLSLSLSFSLSHLLDSVVKI